MNTQPASPAEYVIPDWYTKSEGGICFPWPHGCKISLDVLNAKHNLGASMVLTNCNGKSIAYHSLGWRDHNGVLIGRWDCVNGWTRKLQN